MELRDTLARNVRLRRARLRISQEELAARAGVDRTTVSNVERGVYDTGLDTIEKLAGAFGIAPEELLSNAGL